MELAVDTSSIEGGLRAIVLRNGLLRVKVLPQAGGKIWQITYQPTGIDLLWNNRSLAPAAHPIHTPYDDVWSGGWDELFPVDEEARILGQAYPDHGELWSAEWAAEPWSTDEEVGVVLRMQTPLSRIHWEKTITLRRESARIYLHYRLVNHTATDFPFLWKLHPAFAVSPQHRIDLPAMRVLREPAFPGSLGEAPLAFDWPLAHTPSRTIDLRLVPESALRQLYFFYGTAMQGGWCALTNTATQLSCGLRFDPAVFPSCWVFASYGGWCGYEVAVLEPCTGYPLNFDALMAAGRQRILKPGEVLETDVLFTVERGHAAISGIDQDGRMVHVTG